MSSFGNCLRGICSHHIFLVCTGSFYQRISTQTTNEGKFCHIRLTRGQGKGLKSINLSCQQTCRRSSCTYSDLNHGSRWSYTQEVEHGRTLASGINALRPKCRHNPTNVQALKFKGMSRHRFVKNINIDGMSLVLSH